MTPTRIFALATAIAIMASACGQADGTSAQGDGSSLWSRAIAPGIPWDPPPPPLKALCAPADVRTFQPPPYKPATGAHQGRCTAEQIQGLWFACIGHQGFGDDCNPWMSVPANKDCAACLMTEAEAPAYGPIICHDKSFEMNYAGCMELLGDRDCAIATSNYEACGAAACDDTCGPPLSYEAAYASCRAAADAAGCHSYFNAAACADTEADGGAAAYCFRAHDFASLYTDYMTLFCGP